MAKLFFTLYLMVVASFGVFLFYLFAIEFLGDSIGAGAEIDEKVSKGTFKLLNESLDGLNKQQTDKLLQRYKQLFGDEFKLAEISTLDLSKKQLKQLENGKVVSNEETNIQLINGTQTREEMDDDLEEVDILYFKRPGTSLVWRVSLDYMLSISVNESGLAVSITSGKFSDGMMYLIQSKLLAEEQKKWPGMLNKLQTDFDMPLKITDVESIHFADRGKQLAMLKENKSINITQGTNYATFVQQIPNHSSLLQVGPVEIPWYIRNFYYLFIAAFILSIATTLFLWLWPFWSNLTRLKRAAEDFGAGNLNARISHKGWSPISKITQAFNAMAEQTQQSIRSQKELTSAISHELRTPVSRMRFALEMLDASNNQKDTSRYIGDINKDIDALDLLLEELLSYARFDQKNHQINPRLEKLIPWISQSMDKLMPLADNKTLHYQVQGIGVNETALFEPRLMSRVLDNLVQNALRYARQTVEVTLSKDHSKDHDHYLLIVEDDGDGIAREKQEQIFDAFSRMDASRDRASGGFGLGLAIVDKIIKAHSGTVTVKKSALGGARFEVRIPA